jgi:hypothetical protein
MQPFSKPEVVPGKISENSSLLGSTSLDVLNPLEALSEDYPPYCKLAQD